MAVTTTQRAVLTRGPLRTPIGTAPLQRLPRWIARLPLVAHWMWLSMRHASLTLPSSANPAITAGGLAGESRFDYLNGMGPQARSCMAGTTWVLSGGPDSADEAEHALRCNAMDYPIVMKPDIGAQGHGVRRVENRVELVAYLRQFPRGERIVMQALVGDAGEAGIYYVRRPDEGRGRVTGLLLRHVPRTGGDSEHAPSEPFDSDVTLVAARPGSLCEDASEMVTPAMSDAFDRLARDMQDFHVGCFAVKYESLAALKAGRGFKVIDIDGASADEAQAWNPALSLREAYRILFRKQRLLFTIGDMMRRRGHRPIGPRLLLRHALNQHTLAKRYPASS